MCSVRGWHVAALVVILSVSASAFAQFSLILGTVVPSGAQEISSSDSSGLYQAATGAIDSLALKIGQVCINHEVYLYDSTSSLLSDALYLESFSSSYQELANTPTAIVFEADGTLGTVLGYWLELDSGGLLLMLCQT